MGKENQGILTGLSPEEILSRKEMEGGVKYDDPFVPESPQVINSEPVNPVKQESEGIKNVYSDGRLLNEFPNETKSLGKAQTFIAPEPIKPMNAQPQFSQGIEMGWKNLPMSVLPSKGLFYPDGTKIAIRPAETKEIRHYSTIDEDDFLDLNEKLNFIISKCSVINFPDFGVGSFKDLKQEDRFFILMAIRDLTFLQGENRIILTPETACKDKKQCPINSGIELRTGVLSSYEIEPRVMKYYSPTSRSFIFPVHKIGKEISMTVPSIGVMEVVTNFVNQSMTKGIEVDDSFAKIAPFIFPEWRGLNENVIMEKMKESDSWTKEEFSLYFELSELIKIGTELDVNLSCPTCGAEVTAPITFPGGFKSLFVISNIFGELL
jgi:hypothetical protein